MDNYGKTRNQDFLDDTLNENLKLFKRAIYEAMDLKMQKIDEQIKDVELPPLSREYKKRMNRLFREHNGGSFIPFPEEDYL